MRERFAEMAARVRNWGRWGDDDQLGTLNLVDDDARRRAAASVRTGQAFGLGLPLSEAEGIQLGFVPGRINPRRTMVAVNEPLSPDAEWICASEDVVEMALQCATHWDGLAHVSYGGVIYNGFPAGSVTVVRGRAVRHPPGAHPGEPGGAARRGPGQGPARPRARLSRHPRRPRRGGGDGRSRDRPGRRGAGPDRPDGPPGVPGSAVAYTWPSPGLTMATAEWFHRRDVAAVATDTLPLEVFPGEDEAIYLPVHLLHLVEMGMTQGQNWVLDRLAEACAEDGAYDFLLDATPLPFTNGLGSPVNPVALR